MSGIGRVGGVYAALHAAHMLGDHPFQSDIDAQLKGWPGREGRGACLRHVAGYTAIAAVSLAAAGRVTGAGLRPGRVLAGLAVSAISHYVIDRREPLRRFADATGSGRFYRLGMPRPGRDDNPCLGTGAYALDQSLHIGFLYIAALIIAGGAPRAGLR